MNYHDTSYTYDERVNNLHYAYSKTAAHFAQPLQQSTLKVSPKRLQASLQTIVAMVVYSWAKVSPEMLILDDSSDDPNATMKSFHNDLLQGRSQAHPWWRLVNSQLPNVLKHYGPFCSLNLVRSTVDFFQGCWIEQYNFLGFPGSYDYPKFLRRLNGLRHCVEASMFPMAQFDEKELFTEITSVIAQMENWMMFVNDLMSFYKEFDEPRDQTSLALDKLTRDTITCTEQLIAVFKDKDPRVTWHLSDPRYRLKELYERAGDSPAGLKFREYQQASSATAARDPREWAYPSVTALVEQHKVVSTAPDNVESLKKRIESIPC
ncbi:Trichodiene synthase [Usnea florida]